MNGLLFNVCDIFVNNILTDVLDFSFVYELLKVAALYILEDVQLLYLAEYLFCRFKSYLTAVASVYLISVILSGIVACRNYYTCVTAKRSDCPREHGSRHKLGIDICRDSVCRKDRSGTLSEYIRLYSAVISNSYLKVGLACIFKIVCKSLRSLADSINVHSVCAGSDYASESSRTEFKVTVETVGYLVVLALYALKLSLEVGIFNSLFKPFVIKLCSVCHNNLSFLYKTVAQFAVFKN